MRLLAFLGKFGHFMSHVRHLSNVFKCMSRDHFNLEGAVKLSKCFIFVKL